MADAATTLGSLSTAIEMGFTANLLLTAWAGVYGSQVKWWSEKSKEMKELENDMFIREEIAIDNAQRSISRFASSTKWLWRIGSSVRVVASFALYFCVWHLDLQQAISTCSQYLLEILAHAGPLLMSVMCLVGWIGRRKINKLVYQLNQKQKASRKRYEQQVDEVRKLMDSLPPERHPSTRS
ncbi:MAG: hypothetical protein OXF72_11850 [Gammaproteobacteria bacterium]|nr:hypothetical protein [Gammaproteobacteria bacterium]MCY4277366.1 hypothetical protein [Gammaproteobacteria bacterium]